MNITPGHTIIVSPIGHFDTSLVHAICQKISNTFGYSTEIKTLLTDVSFAYDINREQYNSTRILETLSSFLPERSAKILAITDVDLFIPILTYVYGEAQLGGISAILSIHRLKESITQIKSEDTLCKRVCKEAIHETGHAFNLRHCRDHSCIMHYCRNIKDVDRKSEELCRYCRILLSDEIKKIKGKLIGK